MPKVVLVDPQGRQVELYEATWQRHVLVADPELAGERAAAEAAITAPVAICRSANPAKHPTGLQYYGRCDRPGLWILVATAEVADRSGTHRIMKTVHSVKRPGSGRNLWP